MAKLHAANAKVYLRTVAIPRLLAAGGTFGYFSIDAVRVELRRSHVEVAPATLKRYLHSLLRQGAIFEAGRGWYSSVAVPFVLDRQPVRGLMEELEHKFPYLEFSCWSTAQVAGYGHHLLARFVAFVHTPRDAMESVAEHLRSGDRTVYLHPSQAEVHKNVRLDEKTVVVRPLVSRAPVDGHYAAIEKILVDLYAESRSLGLLDVLEYQRLALNLVSQGRVSMGTLVAYAKRRQRVSVNAMFWGMNQLKPL